MSRRLSKAEKDRIASFEGVGALLGFPWFIIGCVTMDWKWFIIAALCYGVLSWYANVSTGPLPRCRHDRIKGECSICWHYQWNWP